MDEFYELNKSVRLIRKIRPFVDQKIALYFKNGYQPISNYGQYEGKDNSLCFEKILK